MIINPRKIAEDHFMTSSAFAALFELRIRLCAGTTPNVSEKPIKTKLSEVVKELITHYKQQLKTEQVELLQKACGLRNKILHCEFSTARKRLDPDGSTGKSGGVVSSNVQGLNAKDILEKIRGINAGCHVGQEPVSNTETKKLKDIFAWLLEMQGAGEFDDAKVVFIKAITILEEISEQNYGINKE